MLRLLPLRLDALRMHGDGNALGLRLAVPAALLGCSALGWWWSVQMADEMTSGDMDSMGMHGAISFGSFALAWSAMMAAMMLPAVLPVVKLYGRAAAQGRAAPLPFLVAGYLGLWIAMAVPGYLAWHAIQEPLAEGKDWVGRLAGSSLIVAALWQLTPLKTACLRHCRSPMGFFLRFGGRVTRPLGSLRMGIAHGLFCFGCCWALFAVLVAVGTMNLIWMVLLTLLIVLEKNSPQGERVVRVAALAFAVLGMVLLIQPSALTHLT